MSQLISYRSTFVTPDTAEALRQLEIEGAHLEGLRIRFRGVPKDLFSWEGVERDAGPTGLPPVLSMRPTGREVYLSVDAEGVSDPLKKLSLLWSLAVPFGFVPWSRYPVPQPGLDQVFHYLGPWAEIGDYLHGGGRGDLAWPSIVAAAQCEVGKWEGPKPTEHRIQMHLHQLGIHSGPVDGTIEERTLSALRALGLGGLSQEKTLETLENMKTPKAEKLEGRQVGHFSMRNVHVEAFCSGGVEATRTRQGYTIVCEGPGKLILAFERRTP